MMSSKDLKSDVVERVAEIDSRTYHSEKGKLIRFEENNYDQIVLLKRSGGGDWYEMADNSALIFYYFVCRPLKIKGINFSADYDSYYDQYKIGKIATNGLSTTRKRLGQVDLYEREYLIDNRVCFVLKRSITKEQMEALKKQEAKRRFNLNKTINVAHSAPIFYRDLTEMMIRFHRICSSKMIKTDSQTNGLRILTLVDSIMRHYLHSTDLPNDALDGRIEDWKKIREEVYSLKYEIQILDIAKIWSPDTCLGFFEENTELLKQANKMLGKLMEEKRKNEKPISANQS